MTTEAYQVEFEITECKVSGGEGAQGHWKRHTVKGQDTPTYSGFSTGKNAVKGITDLKSGDYVTLQVQDDDTGKYHNILKILDMGRVPARESVGDKAETSRKSTTTPNSEAREKNRSVALSYSKDLVVAGKVEAKDILACADKFVEWLSNGGH